MNGWKTAMSTAGTHADAQDNLALWARYGDLYNEFVRPDRKYTISHYLRTQWAPLLGPARLWFVVALRQRCFWNDKQDWCIVDRQTLARESGLSLRTVKRIIAEGQTDSTAHSSPEPSSPEPRSINYVSRFFTRTRRRRYSQRAARTVTAPNRYQVLLDDPLTPAGQDRLALYLRRMVTGGSPATTLNVLQDLCTCPDAALRDRLRAPGRDAPAIPPADFVLDVVKACCPLPPQEKALYAEIAHAASRLHNRLTRPEHVYMGNQYFRLTWLPLLGPTLALLIVNLRARCYWNERTGELRNVCQASWAALARETGCTMRQLRNLRRDPHLGRFVTTLEGGRGRALSQFRVEMIDPLTKEDQRRFDRACQALPAQVIDPETGQLGMYALLNAEILAPSGDASLAGTPAPAAESRPDRAQRQTTEEENAEILAPSGDASPAGTPAPAAESHPDCAQRQTTEEENAEILAPSNPEILARPMRKFWPAEGLNAEILAPQCGNFGPHLKLLIITPALKGPAATTVDLSPPETSGEQVSALDEELLAVAILDRLLATLAIQEPNRGKLMARRPRCDHVVAWGLYALTQRGLSRNKSGYVYKRLLAADPPPADLLTIATLNPVEWRLFYRARRTQQLHLVSEPDLKWKYALWTEWFDPVWEDLVFDLDLPSLPPDRLLPEEEGEEWMAAASDGAPALDLVPDAVRALLLGDETVEQAGDRWSVSTPDLYRAYLLARASVQGTAAPVDVYLVDGYGQRHPLNAEILALSEVVPLEDRAWRAAVEELRWQMSRAVYDRWWAEVRPLGILHAREAQGEDVCVVLGTPTRATREWLTARQSAMVARTLSGILGKPVQVRFVVCVAEAERVPEG
jgi:hypothetical protein